MGLGRAPAPFASPVATVDHAERPPVADKVCFVRGERDPALGAGENAPPEPVPRTESWPAGGQGAAQGETRAGDLERKRPAGATTAAVVGIPETALRGRPKG